MNLQKISNDDLEKRLFEKSAEERKLTLEIIELLEEVDRRKLHLEKGYGSLIEYCIKELNYSESSAYRRISAMRIVREIPETKVAIEAGALNLVNVAKAQSFFRAEAQINKVYSKEDKTKILEKLKNKSSRDTEKMLLGISPENVPKERIRELTPEHTQVNLVMSESLVQKLTKLKNLLSHTKTNFQYVELIEHMADMALKKLDPEAANSRKAPPAPVTSQAESHSRPRVRSRYIPQNLRREVWRRSHGQCCYRNPETGLRCGVKRFLEIDHINAYSLGGKNTLSNLQLLCDAHNRWKGTASTYI